MPHDPDGFFLEMLDGPSVDATLTTEEDILELVEFNQAQAVEMGRDEWLEFNDGRGPKGDDGTIGVDGKSAYEIAVENGFVGDESAWIASLQGEDGDPGPTGPSGIVKVTHGSDPNVARPAGAVVVYWIGSVIPVNADPDDFLREA